MGEAKGGTVELTDGVFVKASNVNLIRVTLKGKGHCAAVVHGTEGWESDEMDHESAMKLAADINQRVNDALGTTPQFVTKQANTTTSTPVNVKAGR